MTEAHEPPASRIDQNPGPLFVQEGPGYSLTLCLERDQLDCLAVIDLLPVEPVEPVAEAGQHDPDELPPETEAPSSIASPVLTPPDIFWFLQQNNIIRTIDYSAVYEYCAELELGRAPGPSVLARGVEPQKGADGWLELTVKTSGEEASFAEDAKGRMDLRTLNAYSEIEPGQKLGIIHPPQQGTPGMTAHGLPIPAEAGNSYQLTAGEGVELKYNDRIVFATKAGRALLEKQCLSVVDQLVVPGDLDMSVGNIDFNGFVEIRGDVPDDFSIRSTKGIKVGGHVGACRVESDGSIEMTSMAGKETGRIICRGDLRAKFLNQVDVRCFGDILISNEIRNSKVRATGRIVVERGSIIGGKTIALEGIETRSLGTGSGQRTRLIAGVFFPDAERFDYLREQLQNVNRQIDAINEALAPLKAALKKRPEQQGSAEEKRLKILNEQLARLFAEKKHFSAEIAASKPQEFTRKNPKINVLKELLEGVSITLGKSTEEIKITRSGPMSIIENSREGGLRYLSLSPMPVTAMSIEEELLAKEDAFVEQAEDEPEE